MGGRAKFQPESFAYPVAVLGPLRTPIMANWWWTVVSWAWWVLEHEPVMT